MNTHRHQGSGRRRWLDLLRPPAVQLAVIILLALIAYSNTFHVPFIFDDEPSITENEVVHNLGNFAFNGSGYDHRPNRAVAYLSFALNYHFSGTDVVGYHVLNLVIHIINGLLVYALVRLTLRTPYFSRDGHTEVGEKTPFLPFLAALLFVCHPIQTEAVTYIVQRLTSLATLFYLGTLVAYIRWRSADEAGASLTSGAALPWYIFSMAATVLAMKTKEISFTLPIMVVLYEVSFFGRPNVKRVMTLAPLLLTIVIIPSTMLSPTKTLGVFLSEVPKVTNADSALSRWEYLCTQFSVIVTYFRQLVLPFNQNLDYDYRINHSLAEPRALFSLLLLLTILGLALNLYRRSGSSSSGHQASRLICFGILWFFITLAVESSLVPIADVIFEHRVYLPSVGFIIAALAAGALAVEKWKERFATRKIASIAMVVVVVFFTGATVARNRVWQSWETMWQDVKKKSPKKARAYNNLGAYYVKTDRTDEAIREFEKSVQLDPEYLDSLYNLTMLYVYTGRVSEAKRTGDTLKNLDLETFRELDKIYDNK